MFTLSDYAVIDKIYQGSRSITYRAVRKKGDLKCILKLLSAEYPSLEDITILQHEYEIGKKLNSECIIKVYDLTKFQNGYILVTEDMDGVSLKEILHTEHMPIRKFLDVLVEITKCLDQIHQHGVIHNDIKPGNIIIHEDPLVVKIADFGLAEYISDISSNDSTVKDRGFIGTLAYISPEHTGRTTNNLDTRSDLYSLGVVAYEMITGQLPFSCEDPVELMNSHLAKVPSSPHELNSETPIVISNIIMKLLNKVPEERYQSAHGLIEDLSECINQLNTKNSIQPFEIAIKDSRTTLNWKHKLYGRDEQLKLINQTLDRTFQGNSEALLIRGLSGIGKTSLFNEVKEKSLQKNAYFVVGKFEALQRSSPYSGLIQALKVLVKRLLGEPEAQLKIDQEKLLQILGANGQILIDIVPEVELIIGPQPPLQELTPGESQSRFLSTLQMFIKYFANSAHPLIICLDDIHHADLSSLKLIDALLSDSKTHHLLIIASYRTSEVPEDHPLNAIIKRLKNLGVIINYVELTPLDLNDVNLLLYDILRMNTKDVNKLAEIIYQKTAGNPFFINELIRTLHQKEIIHFSQSSKLWVWDMNKIEEICPSNNVLSLIIDNINSMEATKKNVLQIASCFGNSFNLDLIAKVVDLPLDTVSQIINSAVLENIIAPDVDPMDNTQSLHIFKFAHNNLKQGVYNSINADIKKHMHYKVGTIILSNTNTYIENDVNALFTALNQLNASCDLISDEQERNKIAHLNLLAGIKAKSSTAYSAAYFYLYAGTLLLSDNSWSSNYKDTYSLYKELSECEFVLGKHNDAENHFHLLLNNAKSVMEKAEINCISIALYTSVGKHNDAVTASINALKLFDIIIPYEPSLLNIFMIHSQLRLKIVGRNLTKKLKTLGENSDPKYVMITKILAYSGVSFGLTNLNRALYMAYFNIALTLIRGHTPYSSSLFFNSVMLQHFNHRKISDLMIYIDAAHYLEKLYGEKRLMAKNNAQFESILGHYFYQYSKCLDYLINCYHMCIEFGDMGNASFSKFISVRTMQAMGLPLKEIAVSANNSIAFFKINDDQSFEQTMHFITTYIKCLDKDHGQSFEDISIETILQRLPPGPHKTVWKDFYGMKSQYFYMMRMFEKALEMTKDWKKYVDYARTIITDIDDQVMHVLIIAANYPAADNAFQKRWRKEIDNSLKYFKKLSLMVPENFNHKYFFILAELTRLKGKAQEALIYYDTAIEDANKFGLLQYVALINERAAELCIELNRSNLARVYLQEAYYAYSMWGASIKLVQLETQYPLLLKSHSYRNHHESSQSSESHSSSGHPFDIISTLKAIQVITSEIEIDKLLKHILEIMIENAGAERGTYLSFRQGRLFIEAKGSNKHDVILINEEPTEETLPISVITYVQRSREAIVITDAGYDQQFGHDPYIIKNNVKSITCFPISHQQQLIAIAYLENNLIAGAFTPSILEVLKILAGQCAVSFENAKIYSASGRFVPRQYLRYLNKRDIADVKIGDQTQKNMSILFCDIRDYTSLSEKWSPRETFKFINDFLGFMEPVIRNNNGFIDKYIGDAIMALFPDDAESALKAAIGMFENVKLFNIRALAESKPPIAIGIGINTGEIMLGMIGNEKRMEGTVIGDEVNIASRIESITKVYGAPLLISDETKKKITHLDKYSMRLIDEVAVKGKTNTILIWEVFNIDEPEQFHLKKITYSKFTEARQYYDNKNITEAIKLFSEILRINPNDKVVQYHLNNCLLKKKTGEYPPQT